MASAEVFLNILDNVTPIAFRVLISGFSQKMFGAKCCGQSSPESREARHKIPSL